MSKVKSINVPWKWVVLQHDPDLERDRHNELEYRFSNGREFRANPAKRGAYAPTED